MMSIGSFQPVSDYAFIGDSHSAALVSREGSLDWCCLPRFDAGSAFARLLDWERGGHCQIAPVGPGPWQSMRRYLDDTLVLATTFRGQAGEARVLDCLTVSEHAHATPRREILRVVEGLAGIVRFEIRVAPRFDYGEVRPWIRRHSRRLHSAIGGNDAVIVWSDMELDERPDHELGGHVSIGSGDRIRLLLSYCPRSWWTTRYATKWEPRNWTRRSRQRSSGGEAGRTTCG